MAKRGWFGERKRHSEAARLGWQRKEYGSNGRRSRFIKHLGKRAGKKVKRGAKFAGRMTRRGTERLGREAAKAGREVGGEWKEAGVEVIEEDFPRATKAGRKVKRYIGDEYQKFVEEEERIDAEMDAVLEDTDYTYVEGHPRKKPKSTPAKKKSTKKGKSKPKKK